MPRKQDEKHKSAHWGPEPLVSAPLPATVLAVSIGLGSKSVITRALRSQSTRLGLWRKNFAGKDVSLVGGIALAGQLALGHLAAGIMPRLGMARGANKNRTPIGAGYYGVGRYGAGHCEVTQLVFGSAALSAGACGLLDDLDQDPASPKGLRGHWQALRAGKISTGAIKVLVLGTTALASASLLSNQQLPKRRGPALRSLQIGRDTVLIAAVTNLHNLFDLRPGRALKESLLTQFVAALGARLGHESHSRRYPYHRLVLTTAATISALPTDLRQETMLGDTGANALGMVVGLHLATLPSGRLKNLLTVIAVALNLASEKISFSRVISNTPWLDALDRWGTDR